MCKVIRTSDIRGDYSTNSYHDGIGCGSPDGWYTSTTLDATDEELQKIEKHPFEPQRITIGKSVVVR